MLELHDVGQHPISRVQWEDVNNLRANSYNPNHVLTPEMKLLRHSILIQGWIQPILVSHDPEAGEGVYEIIDGFHRYSLAKTDPEVNHLTGGRVPVVIMEMTRSERMMLTIRINRARGNHMAFKMHEIVAELVHDLGVTIPEICLKIGADKHEVELLLQENVFQKKDVKNHTYSKAWVPAKGRGRAKA